MTDKELDKALAKMMKPIQVEKKPPEKKPSILNRLRMATVKANEKRTGKTAKRKEQVSLE